MWMNLRILVNRVEPDAGAHRVQFHVYPAQGQEKLVREKRLRAVAICAEAGAPSELSGWRECSVTWLWYQWLFISSTALNKYTGIFYPLEITGGFVVKRPELPPWQSAKERVRISNVLYPKDRKRGGASETRNGSARTSEKSKTTPYIEKKARTHHQSHSLS